MVAATLAQRPRPLVAEEGMEAGVARFNSGVVEEALSKAFDIHPAKAPSETLL